MDRQTPRIRGLPELPTSSSHSTIKTCKEPGCKSPDHDYHDLAQVLHFDGVPFGMKKTDYVMTPLSNDKLPYYPVFRFPDGTLEPVTVGSFSKVTNVCELCVFSDGNLVDMPPVPMVPGDYVEFTPDEQMNHQWAMISTGIDHQNPLLKNVNFTVLHNRFYITWLSHNPFKLTKFEGPQ
jgi:hypothetical protein